MEALPDQSKILINAKVSKTKDKRRPTEVMTNSNQLSNGRIKAKYWRTDTSERWTHTYNKHMSYVFTKILLLPFLLVRVKGTNNLSFDSTMYCNLIFNVLAFIQ